MSSLKHWFSGRLFLVVDVNMRNTSLKSSMYCVQTVIQSVSSSDAKRREEKGKINKIKAKYVTTKLILYSVI